MPYGWIRRGEQYGLNSSKGGRVSVFGLLGYTEALTSFVTAGTVDSRQVIEWLTAFAETITGPTVVVLDNAPWHRSAAVEAEVARWRERGLHLYYLPPYCPHLNTIETLWRKMKHEWLRPGDYDSKERLHERVREILLGYGSGLFNIDFHLEKMFA